MNFTQILPSKAELQDILRIVARNGHATQTYKEATFMLHPTLLLQIGQVREGPYPR